MQTVIKYSRLTALIFLLTFSSAVFPSGTKSQFEPCAILSAEASSERKGFEKKYAIDGKSNTMWIAEKAHCAGEWVFVDFLRTERIIAIEISTGGRITGRSLCAGRIHKGTIELSSGLRIPFELTDIPTSQRIIVPETPARWVKVIVSGIFPGADLPEPSISEISVLKIVPVYSL